MALHEYWKKRDFAVTPEPRGKVRARNGDRMFVVQKHAASHLHYDFRLELEGVLKSWAVPKGPSMDPSVRRLAMETEDHPFDYGDFEGIIPAGEYGGGTVLLWDTGTWIPIEDPHGGIRAGNLRFELRGHKLRGLFELVRDSSPRSRNDTRSSWRLQKHDDATARPGSDITEERPESVITGRTLEEIAADADRVWHSNRGRVKAGTKAKRSAKAATAEKGHTKVDVPRATVVKSPPTSEDWVHEILIEGQRIIADFTSDGINLLSPDGSSYTKVFPQIGAALRGLRLKNSRIDGVVAAVQADGTTNRAALDKAIASGTTQKLVYFVFDCHRRDGKSLRARPLVDRKATLHEILSRHPSDNVRYTEHVEADGRETFRTACTLNAPGLVSKKRSSKVAAGVSKDWRVVRCPRVTKGSVVLGVKLSNADRVFYPDSGLTKADIAYYYEAIAEQMMPHVQLRPLTLVRCPKNIEAGCTYMRHSKVWGPAPLQRIVIAEQKKSGEYLLVAEPAALIALVQIDILEIHTWMVTAPNIETPNRLVFDLDPGPDVEFSAVVEAAELIRESLHALSLTSFVKTTGGRGLHVVVPIEPRAEWAETFSFAKAFAEALARTHHDRFTATVNKRSRVGKIYIDYLRNNRTATAIETYSTRARPGAPVSVPLRWEELKKLADPRSFTPDQVLRRVKKLKRDPWEDYWTTSQVLPTTLTTPRGKRASRTSPAR